MVEHIDLVKVLKNDVTGHESPVGAVKVLVEKVAYKLNEVIDVINKKDTLYCSGTEKRTA